MYKLRQIKLYTKLCKKCSLYDVVVSSPYLNLACQNILWVVLTKTFKSPWNSYNIMASKSRNNSSSNLKQSQFIFCGFCDIRCRWCGCCLCHQQCHYRDKFPKLLPFTHLPCPLPWPDSSFVMRTRCKPFSCLTCIKHFNSIMSFSILRQSQNNVKQQFCRPGIDQLGQYQVRGLSLHLRLDTELCIYPRQELDWLRLKDQDRKN